MTRHLVLDRARAQVLLDALSRHEQSCDERGNLPDLRITRSLLLDLRPLVRALTEVAPA